MFEPELLVLLRCGRSARGGYELLAPDRPRGANILKGVVYVKKKKNCTWAMSLTKNDFLCANRKMYIRGAATVHGKEAFSA